MCGGSSGILEELPDGGLQVLDVGAAAAAENLARDFLSYLLFPWYFIGLGHNW